MTVHITCDADNNDYEGQDVDELIIDEGVTNFSGDYDENALSEISFPDSVTRIGATFRSNDCLTSVRLPPTITSIEYETFLGCAIEEIELPYGLENIEDGAFTGNCLTSLALPSTVRWIGQYAFEDNQLTEVDFGSLESIGMGAFKNNQLESLYLPDTLRYVSGDAFGGNPITLICIGDGVIQDESEPDFPAGTFGEYGDGFVKAYLANNRAAGDYRYDEARAVWTCDDENDEDDDLDDDDLDDDEIGNNAAPAANMGAAQALAMVQEDGNTISNVPPHLLTQELCLAAVKQIYTALHWIPEQFRTRDVCIAAAARARYFGVTSLKEVLKYVPQALKDEVKAAAESPEYDIKALHEKGIAARDAGKYDNALAFFDKVIELDPANPTTLSARAWTYFLRGSGAADYQKALADMDKAIPQAPDAKIRKDRENRRAQILEKLNASQAGGAANPAPAS